MAQRYIKVLILYIFTTLLSSITVTSKCVPNKVVRFILRTVVGYVYLHMVYITFQIKKRISNTYIKRDERN